VETGIFYSPKCKRIEIFVNECPDNLFFESSFIGDSIPDFYIYSYCEKMPLLNG
jgi:hypothetical protein